MEFAETLPKQIGNVKLNYEFYPGEDIYSDGAIEDEILEITKNAARIEYPKIIEEKNRQIREQEADIQRMRPKEVFADAVTTSRTSILIGQLAKIISQNGVQIGQNRLFAWMRENGYLIIRRGTDYNMPTQRAMEMRLFEIKERTVNRADGSSKITRTTMVTGRGQQYFINKFLNNKRQ